MKKLFVSNSRESTRMFKSNILESLSKVHYSVPLIIYIPVIVYFGWRALAVVHNTAWQFIGSLVAGLLVWTLTEYVMHRFVFHFVPKSKWGLRLHFLFHGVHHDYPSDALRLVLPPSVSIPLATGFYFLFYALIPEIYLNGFYSAFMTGYLFYDITHYALHHATFQNAYGKN